MTSELFWLTLTALFTALMWVPYILDRIAVRGLMRAMGNPLPDDAPQSEWAQRAMLAHSNAIENLVVFAALVLVVHATGTATPLTATMSAVFFFARFAHFFIYVAGIPMLRTLSFAICWIAQMVLALTALGIL